MQGRQCRSREALTDRQLLELFTHENDEDAFAVLLERHGAMVLAVCRRVLRDDHDAEDAFQATWLILARRARALGWSESVAGWLHEVAQRVSLRARGRRSRLRRREAVPRPEKEWVSSPDAEELALLQAEMARLPDKYRSPLVLCYLEGKSNVEAAHALGWPPGSMARRLARARELLRDRLTGRGLTLTAPSMIALLSAMVPLTNPESLRQATGRAVALVMSGQSLATVAPQAVVALVEGVLRQMYARSIKVFALLSVMALSLLFGVGVFVYENLAGAAPVPGGAAAADPDAPPPSKARTFRSNLSLIVVRLPENGPPIQLGITGPRMKAAINIPAGVQWGVQPMLVFGGVGGFGARGIGGGAGALGGGGGGAVGGAGFGGGGGGGGALGGFGFGGGLGFNGIGGVPKMTGEQVDTLVTELRKQNVPGLLLSYAGVDNDGLARIKNLPELNYLSLAGNAISDEGLKSLKELPALRTLDLERTPVTDDGLKHLTEVKKLARLILAGEKITDAGIQNLRELAKLRSLRLDWTGVKADGLSALKSLPALTTLELRGEYTDADMKSLRQIPALTTLRLSQTRVGDEGFETIRELKSLHSLTVDCHFDFNSSGFGFGGFGFNGGMGVGNFAGGGIGVPAGGAGLLGGAGGGAGVPAGKAPPAGGVAPGAAPAGGVGAGFGVFGGVGGGGAGGFPAGGAKMAFFVPNMVLSPDGKVVNLPESTITAKGVKTLAAMTNLEELTLRCQKLKDGDLDDLGKLTKLKKLELFAPEVTNKGLLFVGSLKEMQRLDLGATDITVALAPKLSELKQLKSLTVPTNPFDNKGNTRLSEYRVRLPGVTVRSMWDTFGGMKLPR
jgi:RNA polymerase sigma factor (sigma-70 family)